MRRAEAARGDDADPVAGRGQDFRAFARRRPALRRNADAQSRWAIGQLFLDAHSAGEAAVKEAGNAIAD